MPSRNTNIVRSGIDERWHAIPHEHRVATLVCMAFLLLGLLCSLKFVRASDMIVGFTVTDGTSSSSSSEASSTPTTSSSSSSSSENPPTGNSRRTEGILKSIDDSDVAYMLNKKMLPGCEYDPTYTVPLSPRRYYCNALHSAPLTQFHYEDVPAGIWYEEAVMYFVDIGVLDTTQKLFRGKDTALRAEFATVLSRFHGSVPKMLEPSFFDDMTPASWYEPFVQFAGVKGWMHGYSDCIGKHPCFVMPAATITRAEAVAMIIRYFGLTPLGTAPAFSDVSPDAWYASDIAIAADRCILRGTGKNGRAYPEDTLNRAQMMTMLDRARKNMSYETDCSPTTQAASSSRTASSIRANSTSSSVSAELGSSASSAPIEDAVLHASSTRMPQHPSGFALTTMFFMGFLTLTIASYFLINTKGGGL